MHRDDAESVSARPAVFRRPRTPGLHGYRTLPLALGVVPLLLCTSGSRADEAAIVEDIAAFLRTDDVARRRVLVAAILADPAYDRSRVRAWLHAANLFKPLSPGRRTLKVSLRGEGDRHAKLGGARTVALRLPEGYDERRAWPLIYALHGQGGSADDILRYVERILGPEADHYVIAAPDQYGDFVIHHPEWPPAGEHPVVLRALRKAVHVDSDRVYITGYSLGGHTAWTLAVLHADQFAGAMPLASTFTLILPDLLWDAFLPNLGNLPVLCVWGRNDTLYGGERISPTGGIAGTNRALRERLLAAVRSHPGRVPAVMMELPEAGHGNVAPPAAEMHKLLTGRRTQYPRRVEHTFRHVCQAQAYWLEGHVWTGPQWDSNRIRMEFRPGESADSNADFDLAMARTCRGLLGELHGAIEGQVIRVRQEKIGELTVWIGEEMIDWTKPVTVYTGDRRPVFEGRLRPDLYVCLSQAARTWDLDRLRWAGLRVASGSGTAVPVDADTSFPDMVRDNTRR